MKRNLVIDDDIVENKTLYKKVNDIKKERENEKEKDLINKRKNNIYSQGQSNRKISIFVKPPNRPVRFIFYIFRATLQVIWFLKGS